MFYKIIIWIFYTITDISLFIITPAPCYMLLHFQHIIKSHSEKSCSCHLFKSVWHFFGTYVYYRLQELLIKTGLFHKSISTLIWSERIGRTGQTLVHGIRWQVRVLQTRRANICSETLLTRLTLWVWMNNKVITLILFDIIRCQDRQHWRKTRNGLQYQSTQ